MNGDHIEGGPDCRFYNVRISEELFDRLGMSVFWGEPDEDGFYTPVIRDREVGRLLRETTNIVHYSRHDGTLPECRSSICSKAYKALEAMGT